MSTHPCAQAFEAGKKAAAAKTRADMRAKRNKGRFTGGRKEQRPGQTFPASSRDRRAGLKALAGLQLSVTPPDRGAGFRLCFLS
jgi:hypothetical protein